MAKYRIFQRETTTGHIDLVAEYECSTDFDAIYLARQNAMDESMIICDDDLRVVRHISTQLH